MLKEERTASRAICDAATEGPWIYDRRVGCVAVYHGEQANCIDETEDRRLYYADVYKEFETAVEDGMGWHWEVEEQKCADAEFIAHARTALPAALDALDEMEILIEAEKAKRPIEITGDAATSAILTLELSEMQADRDRWMHMALALKKLGFGSDRKAIAKDRDQWKALAEAWNRAMRAYECSGIFSFACFCCVYQEGITAHKCDLLGEDVCENMENWEFDLERFGKE